MYFSLEKNRRLDGNLLPVTCIATSILTVVLVVVTTVFNVFPLYVLYKDPLKRFTKPVTTFITAIAIMDFLTGALCDLSQARFEIRGALKMETETEFELRGFTAIVGFFTINSATLLIVAMSVERFLTVTFTQLTFIVKQLRGNVRNCASSQFAFTALYSLSCS